MARLLKITYAGFAVGLNGNASCTLTDRYRIAASDSVFSVTFQVVVRNATRATFMAAEAALITAFSTRDGALEVQLGGSDRHDYDPSTNTGFNARPSFRKVDGPDNTANSARYECAVTVTLPASAARSGRRDSTVAVDETASGRRRVTISGEYTALSSNDSLAQYEAAIATYQTAVLADIGGGNFELVANAYVFDDQNKTCIFRRVLSEIVATQGVGETDVAALVEPRLIVRRQVRATEAFPGFSVRPLVNLFVTYETGVDKDVTTDLASVYANTVRPRILQAALEVAGAGSSAVLREEPAFDLTDNRISVSLDLQADAGGDFYQGRVTVEDRIVHGWVLLPVWSEDTYARDVYQGPAQHVKTVRRTTVGKPGARIGRQGIPSLSGFVEVERLRGTDRYDLGVVGDSIQLEAVVDNFVYVRANLPDGVSISTPDGEGVLRLGLVQ